MFAYGDSCSECKLEMVQNRWTLLLLNWLNTCVAPTEEPATYLAPKNLVDVVKKYKNDICENEFDRDVLCNEDLEPFLQYKYPIFRLRYLSEVADLPKKMYLMTSLLLYHCCVHSQNGLVAADICQKMKHEDQDMIVTFCEHVRDVDITLNNVETAIRDTCELTLNLYGGIQCNKYPYSESFKSLRSSSNLVNPEAGPVKDVAKKDSPALKFRSPVTVVSSCVTETSSHVIPRQSPRDHTFYSSPAKCVGFTNTSDFVIVGERLPNEVRNEIKKQVEVDNASPEYSSDYSPRSKGVGFTNTSDIFVLAGNSQTGIIHEIKKEVKEANVAAVSNRDSDMATSGTTSPAVVKSPLVAMITNAMAKSGGGADQDPEKRSKHRKQLLILTAITCAVLLAVAGIISLIVYFTDNSASQSALSINPSTAYRAVPKHRIGSNSESLHLKRQASSKMFNVVTEWGYECRDKLCHRLHRPLQNQSVYMSFSRCSLVCHGPLIWPNPVGFLSYSKALVSLATSKLEYKFQKVPSEAVRKALGEAFRLFLGDLAKLEKSFKRNKPPLWYLMDVKKMVISMEVETDPDPRLKLYTDESYSVTVKTHESTVRMHLAAPSFCGIRHALETLSQTILLDEFNGYFVTLSSIIIHDTPSFKYRGVMIDTGRNYMPVSNLLTTIDAMSVSKLNTFHWRISDATSFPLLLQELPQLAEFGAYDKRMVYTKEDVKQIVHRAFIRGIRVVIEVAVPGPVGRAWSWSEDAACKMRSDNKTCKNILCVNPKMQDSFFDKLQAIYSAILKMTSVNDVFHLSDNTFSSVHCLHDRSQKEPTYFLEQALKRLKLANNGTMPELPIIWYTERLTHYTVMEAWKKLGVQICDWQPTMWADYMVKFRVIHSSKWDLSCEIRNQKCYKYRSWQQLYHWTAWRNVDTYSLEGGEAILWTDLVHPSYLDFHLWPRAAVVAERLWSDMVLNNTLTQGVYLRLNSFRLRMLSLGLSSQRIWPEWCDTNPAPCLLRVKPK